MAHQMWDSFRSSREAQNQALLKRLDATQTPAERKRLVDEIIVANLDLCEIMARRYANRGLEFDDLRQEARVALIGALNRYRPNNNFTAYATATIVGALKRHFRDFGWVVRPPRRLQELRPVAVHQRAVMEQERQGSVSTAELSKRLNVVEIDVAESENLASSFQPYSLDLAPDDPGNWLGWDCIGSLDDVVELVPDLLNLRAGVNELTDSDRRILHLRFVDELTQTEIGERLGVSQMQVSRLLRRILEELRQRFRWDPSAA